MTYLSTFTRAQYTVYQKWVTTRADFSSWNAAILDVNDDMRALGFTFNQVHDMSEQFRMDYNIGTH